MRKSVVLTTMVCFLSTVGLSMAGPLTWDDSSQYGGSVNQDSTPMILAANAKHSASADSTDSGAVALTKQFWVRIYGGYDMAFLNDITTANKSLKAYADSLGGYTTSAGTDTSGLAAGGEFGFNFDDMDAVFVGAENVWTSTQNASAVSGTGAFVESESPSLLSFYAGYKRTLFTSPGARTSVSVAGGTYHVGVDWSLVQSVGSTITGNFPNDTIGGTLGVEEELDLGGDFSVLFSAKGRIASVPKVSQVGNNLKVNGAPVTGAPQTYDLIVEPAAAGYNVLLFAPEGGLPAGAHDAVFDYSGLQADVRFAFHF